MSLTAAVVGLIVLFGGTWLLCHLGPHRRAVVFPTAYLVALYSAASRRAQCGQTDVSFDSVIVRFTEGWQSG